MDRTHARKKVIAVCRRLRTAYGPVEPPPQWPVLDELVATILSQNTSDGNSNAAYQRLRQRFPHWETVRNAPVAKIARAIRPAGLSNVKAPRIKRILNDVLRQHGKLSLEFLHDLPTPQAIEYLSSFSGVGPKTVACVLLFACRKPVLPVDTHVHRVGRRLGLVGPRTSAERAHEELAQLVPPARVLEFHIQVIRHGRERCAARRPKCEGCPLWDLCPAGLRQLRQA